MATLQDTTINDTGFITLPSGTTAQRPASPVVGMVRFNTDVNAVEYYNGTKWTKRNRNSGGLVTGTVTTTESEGYIVHRFNGTGTFTPVYDAPLEVLIVAGGGGGGEAEGTIAGDGAGGGGAGGIIYTSLTTVTVGNAYTITVGAGGTNRISGSNSSAFGLTAIGGGCGGDTRNNNVQSGGSGGGAGGNCILSNRSGAAGTYLQGNAGGNDLEASGACRYRGGAGGGGFYSAGTDHPAGSHNGSDGGLGIRTWMAGYAFDIGGGGGGGRGSYGTSGGNGYYGGGAGGGNSGPTAGAVNQGGGGGAGAADSTSIKFGASGGSGVVFIRYKKV